MALLKKWTLILSAVFFFPTRALAGGTEIVIDGGTKLDSFTGLLERLLNGYIAFIGIGVFAAVMIGGFTYLVSGANADRVGVAKRSILFAVLGAFIGVISYSLFVIIVDMLNSVFG